VLQNPPRGAFAPLPHLLGFFSSPPALGRLLTVAMASLLKVYEMFKERYSDAKKHSIRPASYPWFMHVWRRDCPRILVRRHSKHAICKICNKFYEAMARARTDPDRAFLKHHQMKHLGEARAERQAYKAKRERARERPRKFLSLIIDGADQSNFALPHTHTKVPPVFARVCVLLCAAR
jgi:hypothetical protein